MDYLLVFLTGLIAFTWCMIFAFYLVSVRASMGISHILSQILGKDISMDEVLATLGRIIDQAYQDMKAKEDNEDS